MRTSERLDKIVGMLYAAGAEMRRLEIDLPDGQTLEVLEAHRVKVALAASALEHEASNARRFND